MVDHIIAREFGGADYDPRNLMAMCAHHHDSKSGKEAHGLRLDAVDTINGLVPYNRSQVVDVLISDRGRDWKL